MSSSTTKSSLNTTEPIVARINRPNFQFRPEKGDDSVIEEVYDENCYLKDFVTKFIPLEGIVVDIGAHIGVFTVIAAEKLQPEAIVALEPEISNFDYLQRNVREMKLDKVVTALQVALWNKEDKLPLFLQDWNSGGHSLLSDKSGYEMTEEAPPANPETELVAVTTLDCLLEKLGMADKPIRVMKIDTEGAEGRILEGAQQALTRTSVIVGELHAAIVPEEVFLGLLNNFVIAYSEPFSDLKIRTFWGVNKRLLDKEGEAEFLEQGYVNGLEDLIWKLRLNVKGLEGYAIQVKQLKEELAHQKEWIAAKELDVEQMVNSFQAHLARKEAELAILSSRLIAKEQDLANLAAWAMQKEQDAAVLNQQLIEKEAFVQALLNGMVMRSTIRIQTLVNRVLKK